MMPTREIAAKERCLAMLRDVPYDLFAKVGEAGR